jgi:hypothetical protein
MQELIRLLKPDDLSIATIKNMHYIAVIVKAIAVFSGWQGGFGLKSAALFAIAGYQNRHIKNEEDEAATH